MDELEPHSVLFESAAIVTRDAPAAARSAAHEWWSERLLDELPGCRFAATLDRQAGSATLAARDGRRLALRWRLRDGDLATAPDVAVLTSVAYVLDVTGCLEGCGSLDVIVRLGDERHFCWLSSANQGRA